MPSEDYRRSQMNARILADLYRRADDADRGAPLRAGGVGAGGITIKGGSLRIEAGGNIEVDGDATFGGDTTVGGNMRVTGTLSLPAGIIDNAALANPLQMTEAEGDNDGFGIPTDSTVMASCQLTVPPGFSRALVVAAGTCTAYNAHETLVRVVYSRVWVGDAVGRLLSESAAPEARRVSMSPMKQDVLTGLTGGSKITCSIRMYASDPVDSSTANGASINAYAIFSR